MQICIMFRNQIICNHLFNLLLIVVVLFGYSCVSPRQAARQGYLLNKNIVKTDNHKLSLDEINGFIQQKPNKKALGVFRLSTFIYEHSDWNWLKKKVGSAPVILEPAMAEHSKHQLNQYLAAKGYFHAQVESEIRYYKKKADVTYRITSGKPYTIRNINYLFVSDELKETIFADTANSFIKPSINYDAYLFDEERTRITDYLRNQGYFFFTRDYVLFKVDSNLNCRKMDVDIEIQNPRMREQTTGNLIYQKHIRYKINNITFHTDSKAKDNDTPTPDTLVLLQYPGDPSQPYQFRYIFYDKLRLSPQLLNRQIFTKGGELYRSDNFNLTYSRLSNLGITKFVTINFEPAIQSLPSDYGLLDCQISIGRSNTQIYTIETEATNTGGLLGIGGNLVYANRNLFRGGEVFSLKLKGALEMQKTIGDAENFLFGFNTLETGIEARLEIPRLLAPYASQQFSRYSSPRTTFSSGLNYQNRPDYRRYIANLSFGYEWRGTPTRSHLLIPVELNSVRIFTSADFKRWLDGLSDKRLINQYTDHLVPLMRYVYIFNNQAFRKNKDFMFLRVGIESSGGLLSLIDRSVGAPKNEMDYYTLLGIRYAQFLRLESDYRYYKVLNPRNNIVFRIAAGIGSPYGNSDVLPVEKGFYAGGANGMRGWEIRSLGPGRFSDPGNNFEKMGELWLESNIEYRFPMYSWLNGAVFADAGNIWLLNDNADMPNAILKVSEFGNHIAIDGGLGIRFDLSFFILRVDGAVKLKNPALMPGNQWLKISELGIRKVVWNFGIGYPF